ncbi:MAG: adenosylcobinamide-phosphate synthase CbiB [Desulfuromonadales bacterium]|jgi:adenosylcobinamide-phosphate synthase
MHWLVAAALALDLLLGDPRLLPHPVIWIGRLVNRLELLLTELTDRRRLAGIFLTVFTVGITGLSAWGVLALAGRFHPLFEIAIALWLAFTTIALRGLHRESRRVIRRLEEGDLEEARHSLSLIVSRQTAQMDEPAILRACVETVAENTSDAVIAPLFYLFIGGPVAALMYKAASTLDSMVGYQSETYREFGWASARLDDLLNLVPARLTALLMLPAAALLGLNSWNALRIVWRDARKHKSPNAGYPEAAAAGALGVRLGGAATYFGERVEKPTLGDDDRPLTIAVYRQMIRLMYLTAFLALALGMAVRWWIAIK